MITDKEERVQRRLFYCCNVNWVDPAEVVAYRGEIVRYAYEWPDRPGQGIETAEHHIVLIVTTSGQEELLINVDARSSPSGFCHGYGGSGPCALALSLLAHHLGEQPSKDEPWDGMPMAFKMHNDFVRDYVSRWPMDDPWHLTRDEVASWCTRWLASPQGQEAQREIAEERALREEWAREDAELARLEADDD